MGSMHGGIGVSGLSQTRKRSFPTPDLHRRFGIHNDFRDSSGFLQNRNMAFRSAVLFSLLASSLCGAADPTAAIRAAIQQYVDVREHPDAEALERLFTADADQLVSSGEWRKGREAVVKGTIAASQREAGKRTIAIESIRFLSKNVAIADGRYELMDAAGNTTRKMWTSIVLTRDHSGWHIAAIRNMLPAPVR
jgi:uncharacterized protein (TIGR02246 family)